MLLILAALIAAAASSSVDAPEPEMMQRVRCANASGGPTVSLTRMAMPLHPIYGTRAVGQGAERMKAVGAVPLGKRAL